MKNQTKDIIVATLLVLAAAASRVVLYPHYASSIIAMAVFAGAVFTNKQYAFALPLAAMLLSDVLFEISGKAPGFWGWGQLVSYAALGIITLFSYRLRKINFLNVAGFSLAGSIIFFLVSNFAVWAFGGGNPYPFTAAGLADCYVKAIPFFRNGAIADLVYSFLLFGTYYAIYRPAAQTRVAA